jgi:hypothetical protein
VLRLPVFASCLALICGGGPALRLGLRVGVPAPAQAPSPTRRTTNRTRSRRASAALPVAGFVSAVNALVPGRALAVTVRVQPKAATGSEKAAVAPGPAGRGPGLCTVTPNRTPSPSRASRRATGTGNTHAASGKPISSS